VPAFLRLLLYLLLLLLLLLLFQLFLHLKLLLLQHRYLHFHFHLHLLLLLLLYQLVPPVAVNPSHLPRPLLLPLVLLPQLLLLLKSHHSLLPSQLCLWVSVQDTKAHTRTRT
jgi:hypothetical protein